MIVVVMVHDSLQLFGPNLYNRCKPIVGLETLRQSSTTTNLKDAKNSLASSRPTINI